MKYLERLYNLVCFSRQDVVALTGNEQAAHSLLHNYIASGYIARIRRDLYTAISLETKQAIASRFSIASRITDDACVSYHSAFEYMGYANQVFYEVYVSTNSRFSEFLYDGVTFKRVSPRICSGIDVTKTGIRVTDLERTVIDSIHRFERIGGLEELLRCLMLIPSLQSDKLIKYLDEYEQANLYQRTGFILEQFSDELGLPKSFFDYCIGRIPKAKKYLFTDKDASSKDHVLHAEWMLFAPKDIRSMIDMSMVR